MIMWHVSEEETDSDLTSHCDQLPPSRRLARLLDEVPRWPYLSELVPAVPLSCSSAPRVRGGRQRGHVARGAWRRLSQVSVSGVRATLDPRSPLLRRVLWGCVLTVAFTLMLAQCVNRVLRYLEEPVNVNVRVTHNATLEYPAITACNKNAFNRSAARHLLASHALLLANVSDAEVNFSQLIGVDGLTPTAVWTALAQSLDTLIMSCWFGRGVKCHHRGTWTLVHTVSGPCYTFMLNKANVKSIGGFHNLFLRLHETTPVAAEEESGVRILVHERSDPAVLTELTGGVNIKLGISREVKLELRKFVKLNSRKRPCREDAAYSQAWCQLACFERLVLQAARCRLPFMQAGAENTSECDTPATYENAMRATNLLLRSGGWSTSCPCPRQCRQTAYQMYFDTTGFYDNEIKTRVFYEALVFTQITEERAYPLISLLCDIGATLGLLMGASVLTVCELLEVACSRLATCRLAATMPSPVASAKPAATPTAP